MKKCPHCDRTYPDDTLAFCLVDGAILSAPYDPEATQRIPPSRMTNAAPTEILPSASPGAIRQKRDAKITYVVIAVMTGVIVGLAGIIFIPRMGRDAATYQGVNSSSKLPQGTPETAPSLPRAANGGGAAHTTATQSNSVNPTSSAAPAELLGVWQGQWVSPYGTTFSARLRLEPAGADDGVRGAIDWAMTSTPQESKRSKVGLTAVEYVTGNYDRGARRLVMEGYRKEDPNDIISLDKYRLTLAEGGESLEGKTWNHGGWRGRLSLRR